MAVFLNLGEFGETHVIDGKPVVIVLDEDKLLERQAGAELAVAESSLLFYAAASDLPKRRIPGSGMNVNGREYIIDAWSESAGMAQVVLSQTRSG